MGINKAIKSLLMKFNDQKAVLDIRDEILIFKNHIDCIEKTPPEILIRDYIIEKTESTLDEVTGKSRIERIIFARHMIITEVKKNTKLSLTECAKLVNKKLSLASYACNKSIPSFETDPSYKKTINEIRQHVRDLTF